MHSSSKDEGLGEGSGCNLQLLGNSTASMTCR